jgi:hypothetical protein
MFRLSHLPKIKEGSLETMEDIIECCAGIDVHKEILVVCTLTGPLNQKPQKELREFSASTAGLLELAAWLD